MRNIKILWPNMSDIGLTEVGVKLNGCAIAGTNTWQRTYLGRLLGVHLLGPHVTDLIAEGALAVHVGATADDLAWTPHAHPTLSDVMLEAALGFREAAIHFHTR